MSDNKCKVLECGRTMYRKKSKLCYTHHIRGPEYQIRDRRSADKVFYSDGIVCATCHVKKDFDQYRFREHRKAYETQCRECRNLARRAYIHGISIDDVKRMSSKRCDNPRCENIAYNIDHCHATGKIRGSLCHGCNTAYGLLHENEERIKGLLQYHLQVKQITETEVESSCRSGSCGI